MTNEVQYTFSGHETFQCRYAWLPKAFMTIEKSSELLSDEDKAMVEMGVGKNMVRAIRFWTKAMGIATNDKSKAWETTDFGKRLLGEKGFDPYLEDSQTLWLLHWKLATRFDSPLFAWDYLLNRWHEPEFTRTALIDAFEKEANKIGRKLSRTTLKHHIDVFIHTYVPTSGKRKSVFEDSLDCPLVELNMVYRVGERVQQGEHSRREPIYAFRREEKPEIGRELFAYCVLDFMKKKHPNENTVSFRELAIGHGSPGQIFKLPESSIRERLEEIAAKTKGLLEYDETADIQRLVRKRTASANKMLDQVYEKA